jgi:hypothetical protein
MDSISKGQRNLLLFILGVAILILPIRFLAMSNFEDKKSIDNERSERETYYNDLKAKDANRQQYIDDTAQYTADYQAILDEFPAELYQDNTIMYLQNVKDEYKFDFPSVTMGAEELFYTLGSGATGDVSVDDTATEEDASEVSLDDDATVSAYNCYSASFPVTYEGDYKDIKDVIDYIKNGDYRMTLDDINISFDENEGTYTGDMTITSYAVSGEDRTTDHADVNVQTGTNNIFGNPTVKTTTTEAAEETE